MNWESYLREAGLKVDSHARIQAEKIAGLEALVDQLTDDLEARSSPAPAQTAAVYASQARSVGELFTSKDVAVAWSEGYARGREDAAAAAAAEGAVKCWTPGEGCSHGEQV